MLRRRALAKSEWESRTWRETSLLCVCVHAFVHVCACIFIVHAGLEAAILDSEYSPVADPGYWQGVRGAGLQVAYGAGLGENEISDPFTPILRPLQYYIFSVGSHCHDIDTSYPPSTFIVFISCMIYLCPVPILKRIRTSHWPTYVYRWEGVLVSLPHTTV